MALSAPRRTKSSTSPFVPDTYKVKGGVKIYQGGIVVLDAGYAKPGVAASDLFVVGRAKATVDNIAGSSGDKTVSVEQGTFYWDNTSPPHNVTQAMVGQDCYVETDCAVTSRAASHSRAGVVVGVDTGGVWVNMQAEDTTAMEVATTAAGDAATVASDLSTFQSTLASAATGNGASLVGVEDAGLYFGTATVEAVLAEVGASIFGLPRRVRGVVYVDIPDLNAFTVAGNDGLTYTAGQRVLLTAQTTKSQNGLYEVGTVAVGVARLTRPADWRATAAIPNGVVVEVAEGTVFGGSTWKSFATGAKVIGTDDPLFWPRMYKGSVTLAAGTGTHGFGGDGAPAFVRAAGVVVDIIAQAPSALSYGTTEVYPSTVTPGVAGVAAIAVTARSGGTGLADANNAATYWVAVHNW